MTIAVQTGLLVILINIHRRRDASRIRMMMVVTVMISTMFVKHPALLCSGTWRRHNPECSGNSMQQTIPWHVG